MRLHLTIALAALSLAACQTTVYEDKLPPDDYFDPGSPSSKGYGGDGGTTQSKKDGGCVAKSCGAQGIFCGPATDGCGGSLNCGGCALPQTCGRESPGVCGCKPTHTCVADVDCGSVADGCGAAADCGGCPTGQTCGANNKPNQCGAGTCTPETDAEMCARLSKTCDGLTASDNFGKPRTVASCGTCTAPQTCGATGLCSCQPESDVAFCSRVGKGCDAFAGTDNCGAARTANCGSCSGTLTCVANTCVTPGLDAGTPGPDASSPDTGPAACPEANRLCGHDFSYQGSGTETTVEVRGSFDGWGKGQAMTQGASNVWTASVPVPWNVKVSYKFVLNGSTWIADPANPKSESDGLGGKNSVVDAATCDPWTCNSTSCTAATCTGETPSCSAVSGACECTATSCTGAKTCNASSKTCVAGPVGPALQLEAAPTLGADSYSFKVVYLADKSGDDLDLPHSTITLNGAAANLTYDPATKSFTVSATGVAPGKYSYLLRVKDVGGRPSTLYVPFWVEASAFTWKDAFLYQIMTDRFVNADKTNDFPIGVEQATEWQGGDFAGVAAKLEGGYFEDLGANAIWLSSPVASTEAKEPGKGEGQGHDFSGFHAYWPIGTGWTFDNHWAGMTSAIEKRFGKDSELKDLVNKAHARGLRVLVDFVPNHVHQDAPLFKAHNTDGAWFNLPYHDCGGENLWDVDPPAALNRENCWFDPFLPDFNTSSSVVDDVIANHAVWLMEEFNLDGFRVDASKHVDPKVLVDLRSKIDKEIATGLHFYMVGESLGGNEGVIKECMGPTKLDGSVNDPLHNAIVNILLSRNGTGKDLDNAVLYDEYTWTNGFPGALMGHFLGSHDTARAISIAANNVGGPWSNQPGVPGDNKPFGRLRLAQAFLLTYDSIPIIWMGDEYGQPGSRDPDNRRMMKFDGDLTQLQKDTLAHAQKLGKARLAHAALRRGSRKTLAAEDEFYAFARQDGADTVVVALNLSESSVTKSVNVGSLGLSGTLTDQLTGATASVTGSSVSITLGGLSAAILTK